MSRFIMPRQGVNGQNLNPGDGAQLFFKNEGLTTDRDTFSDEDLTTANENPVTADATGLFPAIWMAGSYDVSLKDKNGVQLWGPEHMDTQASTNESIAAYVADMVATSPDAGTTYQTTGYIVDEIGGAGMYLMKTSAQAATDGDTIDELTNHTCANAIVAILQHDGIVDFRQSGGRAYDVATTIDNSAALLAADAQGFTIQIVGAFYFNVAVDLGLGSTNVRTQILGVENVNFDGVDKSALYFDGTAGITVNAGTKIHDLDIENIGTLAGSGKGLVANNVHAASIKNVTVKNFEIGAYIFCWVSVIENLITYQCTSGIETYGECTSTTFQSCYARDGTTGITLGATVTYSTFLNCVVEDCSVPYLILGGDNVDFNNCGAEIDENIEGFFHFNGTSSSTITISGGRYIMDPTFTTNCFMYSTAAATNESAVVALSRMTSNSTTNPSQAFLKGKLRAVFDDSCMFGSTFDMSVYAGDFGSIMMDGRSSAALRRHSKSTPKVGSSQDDADSIPNMLSVVIEEVIDFSQAITDTEQVFIKHHGTAADSFLQGKIEVWPMVKTGTTFQYQEGYFWGTGSSNGDVRNPMMTTVGTPDTGIDGTIIDYKGNDATGFQNYYLSRTAIQTKCFVRVTATGWADSGYRDQLITLTVGPDDA